VRRTELLPIKTFDALRFRQANVPRPSRLFSTTPMGRLNPRRTRHRQPTLSGTVDKLKISLSGSAARPLVNQRRRDPRPKQQMLRHRDGDRVQLAGDFRSAVPRCSPVNRASFVQHRGSFGRHVGKRCRRRFTPSARCKPPLPTASNPPNGSTKTDESTRLVPENHNLAERILDEKVALSSPNDGLGVQAGKIRLTPTDPAKPPSRPDERPHHRRC